MDYVTINIINSHGIVDNKLIPTDSIRNIAKNLPTYGIGLFVVVVVLALIVSDVGSMNIDTLIEWPLSTFSLGLYESVIPVSDHHNTVFGNNPGRQALRDLTSDMSNREIDSKAIDANGSFWDKLTFSTVGYRPTGALQSGNFSYSISFWCKIVILQLML